MKNEIGILIIKGVVLIMKNQKLFDYIATLTPEQKEKILIHLPQLISLLEESNQPYRQAQ